MSNNIENFIFGAAGTNVLVVSSGATIQGAGFVGDNQLTLNNQGTIDANVSHTLTVEASGGTTNTGTLEATAGGSLHLVGGFTNTGGSILADGSGSVVELGGATITGGTLTTTNTGTIQNSGTATLNGVTIGTDSTLSLQNGSVTNISGTITNMGTIAMNSAGNVTELVATGATTTLSGGTVSMSNNIENFIFGNAGTNVLVVSSGATIQGAGFVGDNQLTLNNEGTILANVSNALTVQASGGATNSGTFQADSGSSLIVLGNLTNLSGTTLTGGTYNVYSGTMQLPGNVNTNAATILLDGATGTPHLNNGGGTNALANFATNAAAGQLHDPERRERDLGLTGLQQCRHDEHRCEQHVHRGRRTQLSSDRRSHYLQTATSNLVAGTTTLNGGVLQGFGTVTGNLSNVAGTVHPGDGPGILTVTGNYTQGHQAR